MPPKKMNLKFTPMEKLVLDTLMKTPDVIVEHEELNKLDVVVPRKTNYIAVHVKNIRKKLKKQKNFAFDIEAVRGSGYRIISKEK